MNTKEIKKSKLICFISCALMILCSIASSTTGFFAVKNVNVLTVGACLIVAISVLALYLTLINKEISCAILSAIIGVRMMPKFGMLSAINHSAYLVYYVVTIVIIALFLFSIIIQYRKQKGTNQIGVLDILALLIIIPFFTYTSSMLSPTTIALANGSLLYSYICSFVCYGIGCGIILLMAHKSKSFAGTELICKFQIIALSLNLAQKIAVVAYKAINEVHISKSYYCWIALFFVLIILFCVVKSESTKKQKLTIGSTAQAN